MTVTMNSESTNGEVAGSSSAFSQSEAATTTAAKDSSQSFKKARYSWQIKGKRWQRRHHCHKRNHHHLHKAVSPSNGQSLRPESAAAPQPAEVPQEPTENPTPKVGPPDPVQKAWQSRQFAQGVIDNAINKVLGDMGLVPPQPDVFGGFGEGYVNAQNIVNEGVSEAIRQQGLQRRHHQVVELWPGNSGNSINSMAVDEEAGPSDANMEAEVTVGQVGGDVDDDGENNRGKRLDESDSKDSSYLDGDPSQQCDDLLDTAVSCAINQKGLGMFPIPY